MGHYLAEMVSDGDHKKEQKESARRLKVRTEKIKALIKKHGIAKVFAMYLEDPTGFRIQTGA